MTASPTLNRIRRDLRRAGYRLNIARIDGDADMAGAIETDIARLKLAETSAEALLRHRDQAHHKHQHRPRRRRRA